MKLLEEDEDETMHSGADVEAFTAALNRDIEGDTSSTSHPPDAEPTPLSQANNQLLYSQWQPPSQDGSNNKNQQDLHNQIQQDFKHIDRPEHRPPDIDTKQHVPGGDSQSQDVNTSSQSSSELPLQHNQSQRSAQERTSLELSQSSSSIPMRDPNRMHNASNYKQFQSNPRAGQQQSTLEQSNNPMARGRQIPFGSLLPLITSELDKEKATELETLYAQLKKNEIAKEGFVRVMRDLVGDQMLRLAVAKMQAQPAQGVRNLQMGHNQFLRMPSHALAQHHHLRPPPGSTAQFADPSFAQLHQRSQSGVGEASSGHHSTMQAQKDSGQQNTDNNPKTLRDLEHLTDSRGIQVGEIAERPTVSIQGLTKQQQQHLHFSQSSYPMYGSGHYHPYSGTNASTAPALVKPQPLDPQMRQHIHPGFGSTPVGGTTQTTNATSLPKFERQNSFSESQRVPSGSISQMPNNPTAQQSSTLWLPSAGKEQKAGSLSSIPYLKQEPVDQSNEQQQKTQSMQNYEEPNDAFPTSISAHTNSVSPSMTDPVDAEVQGSQPTSAPAGAGNNAKAPSKKPSVGQKKPLDTVGSSSPQPNKKQKSSGAFLDQSIDHLNDVTAVSGVNIREEEEQLFSGSKDEIRASDASRRVVQEEEDRVLLQKKPLQRKLAEIMTRFGLKNVSNDVERCLSLCVEERLRGLISNLIRISKQRVDSERTRHQTVVTSDVRQKITEINRKAREEWEKKQAEAEKLRKVNEPDSAAGADGDKEKDEPRGKGPKVNKEEDDKMRTTAANVAARAAVGGDDMLSKWQLMAEQARQKREGGSEVQPDKDTNSKPFSNPARNSRDNHGMGRKDQSIAGAASGGGRQLGRNQAGTSPTQPARTISVKDVIAVLEREPQMMKSTTLYRLYEKVRPADAPAPTE